MTINFIVKCKTNNGSSLVPIDLIFIFRFLYSGDRMVAKRDIFVVSIPAGRFQYLQKWPIIAFKHC